MTSGDACLFVFLLRFSVKGQNKERVNVRLHGRKDSREVCIRVSVLSKEFPVPCCLSFIQRHSASSYDAREIFLYLDDESFFDEEDASVDSFFPSPSFSLDLESLAPAFA